MNFFNTIVEKLSNKIFDKFISFIFTPATFALFTKSIYSLIEIFNNFIFKHTGAIMILISSSISLNIIFIYYLYYKYNKKLVNHILVDKKGMPYCPHCRYLIKSAKEPEKHLYSFYCIKCKEYFRPTLDNGKFIDAGEFIKFQHKHPQQFLTKKLYNEMQDQYLRDQGLLGENETCFEHIN